MAFGKDNFTKIFEGELDNSNENLITKYLQFIGDVDQSITNTGRVDYDYKAIQYERLALSLAKTVTSNEFVKIMENMLKCIIQKINQV